MQLLWELQEIDAGLDKIRDTQESFTPKLDNIKEDIALLEGADAEYQSELAAKEVERRDLRDKVEQLKGLIAQSKDKIAQIANNKEYFAVLKELEHNQRQFDRLETELTALVEEIDSIKEQIAENAQDLAAKAEEMALEEKAISAKVATLERKIRSGEKGRQTKTKGLDPIFMRRYQRIRKRFKNAVVTAKNGTCLGCNVNVPPQVYIDLLKGQEIMNCPNCQRIMVNSAAVEPDKKK
jgi:predicted  nucleic acid-binding Zn-ribbon protein